MHPRNRFRDGYDFHRLIDTSPDLEEFVAENRFGALSIDFADPAAVAALNAALIKDTYGLMWSVPRGALCPAVPGRSDYLHHLADLLADNSKRIPRGASVSVLDIGMGANAIYPMLGAAEYGWRFVGTEIDKTSMHWARQIIRINPSISKLIESRHQTNPAAIFAGITKAGEHFDASMCNPPFHASAKEAAEGSQRKRRNLKLTKTATPLNFGGAANELWTPGGEVAFVTRMIKESAARPVLCRWFTTLVSKSEHLPLLKKVLRAVGPVEIRVIEMAQGHKKSRILAWRF